MSTARLGLKKFFVLLSILVYGTILEPGKTALATQPVCETPSSGIEQKKPIAKLANKKPKGAAKIITNSMWSNMLDIGYEPDFTSKKDSKGQKNKEDEWLRLCKATGGSYGESSYYNLKDYFNQWLGKDIDDFFHELQNQHSLYRFKILCSKLQAIDQLLQIPQTIIKVSIEQPIKIDKNAEQLYTVNEQNPQVREKHVYTSILNEFIRLTEQKLKKMKEAQINGDHDKPVGKEEEKIKQLFEQYCGELIPAIHGTRSCYKVFAILDILRNVENSKGPFEGYPDPKTFKLFRPFDYAGKLSVKPGLKGLNLQKDFTMSQFVDPLFTSNIFQQVYKDLKFYFNDSASSGIEAQTESHKSLMLKFRKTKTVFGSVVLQYLFKNPSCSHETLLLRQSLIKKLVESEDFYNQLMESLDRINKIQYPLIRFIDRRSDVMADLIPSDTLASSSHKDFYPESYVLFFGIQKLCKDLFGCPTVNSMEKLSRNKELIWFFQQISFCKKFLSTLEYMDFTWLFLSNALKFLNGTQKLKSCNDIMLLVSKLVEGGSISMDNVICNAVPEGNKPLLLLLPYVLLKPQAILSIVLKKIKLDPKSKWNHMKLAAELLIIIVKMYQEYKYIKNLLWNSEYAIAQEKNRQSELKNIVSVVKGLRTIALEAKKIEDLFTKFNVPTEALALFKDIKYFNSCKNTVDNKILFNKPLKDLVDQLKTMPVKTTKKFIPGKDLVIEENIDQTVALGMFRTWYPARWMISPVLEAIGEIDAIASAATLVKTGFYSIVEFGQDMVLNGLWYPMIDPEKAIANDFALTQNDNPSDDPSRFGAVTPGKHIIISGVNAGGKTTNLRAILLAALMAQVLGIVPATGGQNNTPIRMPIYSYIGSVINIDDDQAKGFSKFMSQVNGLKDAKMNLAKVVIENYRSGLPTGNALMVVDEIFSGTNQTNGVPLAIALAKNLTKINPNINLVFSTHFAAINWIEKYLSSRIGNFVALRAPNGEDTYKICQTAFKPCTQQAFDSGSEGIEVAQTKCNFDSSIIKDAKEIRSDIFTV